MSTISRISSALRRSNASASQKVALRRELEALRGLKTVIHNAPRVTPKPKTSKKRKKYAGPAKMGTPCTFCGRLWPHQKEDWRWHGFKLTRLRRSWFTKTKSYPKSGPAFHAAAEKGKLERAFRRRTAIFEAEAPNTFARIPKKCLRPLIEELSRVGKHKYMNGLEAFRQRVRVRYGGATGRTREKALLANRIRWQRHWERKKGLDAPTSSDVHG